MKKAFIFVSIMTIITLSASYAGSVEYWATAYGGGPNDEPTVIRQTTDGGYVMIGSSCLPGWKIVRN